MAKRISLKFLDHVAIRVQDLERSAQWYENILGLRRVQPEEWKPWLFRTFVIYYEFIKNQTTMQFLKFIFGCILVASVAFLISCGGHSHEEGTHTHDEATTEQAKQGKEYTSKYICPMHCEGSGSDQTGKCPKCGMDYVLNKDYKAGEGHDHSHDGDDHEHD